VPTVQVQLATRQHRPTGVAIVGSQLYWASEDDGTVATCNVDSCAEADRRTIVSGLAKPRGIAADEATVYVLDAGPEGTHLSVLRCPKDGCSQPAAEEVVSFDAIGTGIAINSSDVIVGAWDRLLSCPRDDCASDRIKTLAEGGGITGVALDESYVYFARTEKRAIYRCPLAGCGPSDVDSVSLSVGDRYPISIATDGRTVYWTNYDYFALRQQTLPNQASIDACPAAGCAPYAPSTSVHGDVAPWGLALDQRTFYWTDYVKGTITRVPRPSER
jgi:hypothetical protein